MNFSGYRYYKLNYGILKFLRLWNTEPKAPEVLLRLVLLYSFLMGSVVQVAALCMNEYSVTEICRIVIFIHCSYSFFNKYLMMYINIKKVKFLFARVEQDWNRLDNTDEYDILKRYTDSSKLVRTIFILLAVPGSLITVMYGYAPIVLDFLMPLNESRPRRFLFAVEFCVIDPIEHFVSINTILSFIIFLGVAAMTITDGSVVMFIMHNCAMFKIAGHRMQRAINAKETLSVRTKLVEATMIHQGAIEFADVQREIYSISYFGFLVLGSTSITMTLYTLSNAVKVTQATRDLTEAAYFLILQFTYLFLCNYVAQLLINHSSNVFGIIYDTEWYSIPVPVQKFIILIMKRSLQPCILTLGKMYPPSCEGFAMICNMSMSYFMFLFSIQRSET